MNWPSRISSTTSTHPVHTYDNRKLSMSFMISSSTIRMNLTMDKSYVTVEQNCCIVCGKEYDTGAILLDRRMRDTFDRHTVTGMGLCPDHQEKYDEGFIALVECDQAKTKIRGDVVQPEEAYRTGNYAHVRKEIWTKIFDTDAPNLPMVFIEIGVIAMLEAMTGGDE